MRRFLMIAALTAAMVGQAMALDAKPYFGNWSGTLNDGKPVAVSVPEGVVNGEPVGYLFNNENQGPQSASAQGQKLRLDNPSGSYILLGPVKGNRLTFHWVNGVKSATAILTRY